jgi:beta-carotene 15,15'-dioxygenase
VRVFTSPTFSGEPGAQRSSICRTPRVFLMPLVTALLFLTHRYWISFAGTAATAIAAALIVTVGIPHGTLDVEIAAARLGRHAFGSRARIVAAYVGCAAATTTLWSSLPALALILFLILSIIHFGSDWQIGVEPFFAMVVGWALIAVPALSHPRAVEAIFGMLTGNAHGATVAAMLACTAIPALLGATIFASVALRRGEVLVGIDVISCLIAAITLPPLIGFAIFFCGLHAPRHLTEAVRQSGAIPTRRKSLIAGAVMALSFGIAALLFVGGHPAPVDTSVVRTAFILLSILTVPHFILERKLR